MVDVITRDCKGSGALYRRRIQDVPDLVRRLLEHGRKTYGDKIVSINIEVVSTQKRRST